MYTVEIKSKSRSVPLYNPVSLQVSQAVLPFSLGKAFGVEVRGRRSCEGCVVSAVRFLKSRVYTLF